MIRKNLNQKKKLISSCSPSLQMYETVCFNDGREVFSVDERILEIVTGEKALQL